MKPSMKPQIVQTSRGISAFSHQERYSTLQQQPLFTNNIKTSLPDAKPSMSASRAGPHQRSIHRSHDSHDGKNELVKYMSNLPTFLQHMENQSNVQDKALNFGVLDWSRLEKWKHNECVPPVEYPRKVSSTSTAQVFQDPRKAQPTVKTPKEESLRYHSYALEKKRETRSNKLKFGAECHRELENIVLVKRERFVSGCSESSRFTESPTSLKLSGNKLSDFFCSQELKSGEFSVSEAVDVESCPSTSERQRSSSHEQNDSPSSFLESSDKKRAENAENIISVRRRMPQLRKLLDPLLRHKGAHGHAAKTVSASSKGPNGDNQPNPKRPATLQALLQVTMKNWLPFFKLVVNNSSEMLAATVTRLPVKSDSCMTYAFYSVHEINKASAGWMGRGSRSNKSCNLGYTIVGQMKILRSNGRGSMECVLYGVDRSNEPEKELVAVIVGNRSETKQHEEDEKPSGTVVILPSGVHGLPIEGGPSSLISRWRFGGSCDCGGWDVGCKLRVLVDCRTSSCDLLALEPSCCIDQVDLYTEGCEERNKPAFTMKPFSGGYYSIELDSSISLLEAFGTCVAHVTCSKFPEIADAKNSGSEDSTEAIADADRRKTPTTFQEQLPVCLPLSPAGRI